jgi:hypothetical protein
MGALEPGQVGQSGHWDARLGLTAASGLPEPVLLAMHPILRNLPNKLVHFILDYHPDAPDFHSVLERLMNMPDVTSPLSSLRLDGRPGAAA